jgi:exo-beta-1,3-glucanase (GH17 family)
MTRGPWRRAASALLGSAVWLVGAVAAAEAPSPRERVREAIAATRFVAYTPRAFAVEGGLVRPAPAEAIRGDLELLRADFDGLVTYSSANGLDAIPGLAASLGFRAVILGVWDPRDPAELELAVAAARAHPSLVIALALGNEGLVTKRYAWSELEPAIRRARAALPGVAITTSEPFSVYLADPPSGFFEAQDFLLPNVHPIHEPWWQPDALAQGVAFVREVTARLHERAELPILVKETGLPSGPAERGFSEARQAEFWALLARELAPVRDRAIAAFEAFDGAWRPAEQEAQFGRPAPEEAYWGLLRADGSAKPALEALRALRRGPAVVMVHGLGYSSLSMEPLAFALGRRGWRTAPIDHPSKELSVDALVERVERAVADCCAEASALDFVTHSIGGILVRVLAERNGTARIGRVVMLGPPNGGSELVDFARGTGLARLALGPAGAALGTRPEDLPQTLGPVRFELGVIGGLRNLNPISRLLLRGPDDGRVAVERTKVAGMRDLRAFPVAHRGLLGSEEVAEAVHAFLATGAFGAAGAAAEESAPAAAGGAQAEAQEGPLDREVGERGDADHESQRGELTEERRSGEAVARRDDQHRVHQVDPEAHDPDEAQRP